MSDELLININDQSLSGWASIMLARGIDNMPSSFDIMTTERYPTNPNEIFIQPGDSCTITIGGDLVFTGYVDQYSPEVAPDKHNVRIRGRSKCQDLVDCSAGFTKGGNPPTYTGNVVNAQSALQLITTFCKPFRISVVNQAPTQTAKVIPQFYINIGETVFEIIDRVARYCGFLAYDDPNGNLVLATPGQTSMASGFSEGQHIQVDNSILSMNSRYSDYYTLLQAAAMQNDLGPLTVNGYASDAGVQAKGRFRPLASIVDYPGMQTDFAQNYATWEANRRWGRSLTVKLTCNSWRDSAGTLWQQNAFVPINIPSSKLVGPPSVGKGWVISDVTYSRNIGGGTTSQVTIMPDAAFYVEPIVLQPGNADLSTPNSQYLPPGSPT